MTTARSIAGLVVILAITYAAAALGSLGMSNGGGEWYRQLNKPAANPPGWVFGVMWPVLYTMMAVAAWLVWRRAGWSGARGALGLYAAQLALNALWTLLFFTLHRMGLAFAELVALWILIVATTAAFARHSVGAGVLMTPYLLWVTFAGWLNYGFWRLNL